MISGLLTLPRAERRKTPNKSLSKRLRKGTAKIDKKRVLRTLPQVFKNKSDYETDLEQAFESSTVKLTRGAKEKRYLTRLSERDEMADICLDSKGKTRPDSS
jgi:type I restriction enzyme M protein